MRLITALMMIVADIIARKPSKTEMSFHFVASFASAFAGSTKMSPSHTMIPTAIKNAIICALSTIRWMSVMKSEPASVISVSGSASHCIAPFGPQSLKLAIGSFPS